MKIWHELRNASIFDGSQEKSRFQLGGPSPQRRLTGQQERESQLFQPERHSSGPLVSGMPVSFKINLYEPLYAARKTIGIPETIQIHFPSGETASQPSLNGVCRKTARFRSPVMRRIQRSFPVFGSVLRNRRNFPAPSLPHYLC